MWEFYVVKWIVGVLIKNKFHINRERESLIINLYVFEVIEIKCLSIILVKWVSFTHTVELEEIEIWKFNLDRSILYTPFYSEIIRFINTFNCNFNKLSSKFFPIFRYSFLNPHFLFPRYILLKPYLLKYVPFLKA